MDLGGFRGVFGFIEGKNTPSPSQLGQKLLQTLPKILTQSFRIYVLGDTAFGTINLINQIRGDSFNHHGILGIAKSRTLQDGRKVSEIKTRGQQVYLNGLNIPVFLSWIWLKRDGKRVQRFVISTKQIQADKIGVIQDQLNTHVKASLYKAFEPKEAKRILDKLEFHYTPKHGSWLQVRIPLRLS